MQKGRFVNLHSPTTKSLFTVRPSFLFLKTLARNISRKYCRTGIQTVSRVAARGGSRA